MQVVQPDISLVLPAFDEQDRLPVALDRLDRFGAEHGQTLELIVVDDGSLDRTAAVAEEWRSAHLSHRTSVVVRQSAHRGKGAAVRTGMALANAPIVGYCDVDLSAGTDALALLLDAMRAGTEVALASRGLPDSVLVIRQPWYREIAGRTFNLGLRVMTGVEYRDTQCGLKLFTARAGREIFRHQRVDGFAFDAEVVLLADRLGLKVQEIPVCWTHDSHSRVSLVTDSLAMAKDIVRVVRRLRKGGVHALGVPVPAALQMMMISEKLHWWHVAKRRVVMQILDRLPGGNLLDVGCGGGAMLLSASRTHRVFGVDLAPEALEYAQGHGLRNLARTEASRLPFATGSFQVVLLLDVLEHHARPEDLLEEVHRVLAPGGALIVTVPAFGWMWSYADHVLGHYRRYTAAELGTELDNGDFELERLTYFHSWLLPVAWVFRKLRALLGRGDSADDFELPGPLNAFFSTIASAELRVLNRRDLPFGLSILAHATAAVEAPSGDAARVQSEAGSAR